MNLVRATGFAMRTPGLETIGDLRKMSPHQLRRRGGCGMGEVTAAFLLVAFRQKAE